MADFMCILIIFFQKLYSTLGLFMVLPLIADPEVRKGEGDNKYLQLDRI